MMIRRFLAGLLLLTAPALACAHGAMQKIVEEKYLLNLTSVPISPFVGQKQQNILAISDLRNNLIAKDVRFDVSIKRNGKTFYEGTKLVATGGLLPFEFAYPEPGTYEFFASFTIPGDAHRYAPEDFWVQAIAKPRAPDVPVWPAVVAVVVGFCAGFLARRRIS